MFRVFFVLVVMSFVSNSLPQYEDYGEYSYEEEYQDYYSDPVERSDTSSANRFSRQTFSNTRNTGNRATKSSTSTPADAILTEANRPSRPTFQRQQSSRQTANPPLGPYRLVFKSFTHFKCVYASDMGMLLLMNLDWTSTSKKQVMVE